MNRTWMGGRLAASVAALAAVAVCPRPAAGQVVEVVVGVTATCPHGGLKPCWAGAYDALTRLDGVAAVDRTPDVYNSTASVLLRGGGVPDPDAWAARLK